MAALAIALCFLASGATAAPPKLSDLAGFWTGAIEVPGSPLQVEIVVADDTNATINIPAQGITKMPLTIGKTDADLTLLIDSIPGKPTFHIAAAAEADTLKGEFKQGGQTFPYTLKMGENVVELAKKRLEGWDEFMAQVMKDYEVPGVGLAIVYKGEVILSKGYGHRNVEKDLPVTAKTQFAIGSSTKAFTCLTLATLVEEGKLTWEDRVEDVLPDFRLKDEMVSARIQVRDLVSHVSGMPRHDLLWYNNEEMTRGEIVKRLRHLELNKDLREEFQYNNLMYIAAGVLTEHLAGGTWEEAVTKRVLDPLEMNETNFGQEDMEAKGDFATGYNRRDGKIVAMPFRDLPIAGPAGNINSNADDMAKWLLFQLGDGKAPNGKEIVSNAMFKRLHTPLVALGGQPSPKVPEIGPGSYAMGWFVDTYRGRWRIRHGGNIDGFSADVRFYPTDDLGIVVLANKAATPIPALIINHIVDRVLDLPKKDWAGDQLKAFKAQQEGGEEAFDRMEETRIKDTKPSFPVENYAGEYEHPGYGKMVFEMDGDVLKGAYHGIPMPLEHWHYNTFNVTIDEKDPAFENSRVNFLVNEGGDLTGLEVNLEPAVEPIKFALVGNPALQKESYLTEYVGEFTDGKELTATFAIKDGKLTLSIEGQPDSVLIGTKKDRFRIQELPGYNIEFTRGSEKIAGVKFLQPNGVFEAKKSDENEKKDGD